MENWIRIRDFPKYEVSDHGNIRSEVTGRLLRFYENKDGVVHVGLMRNGLQRRRSVAKLVAEAFVPRIVEAMDTPICLNGDRWDCHKDNLKWRPRWFAVKYNRQFHERYEHHIDRPIREVKTGLLYRDSFDAATMNGLLESDVVLSIFNNTYVWPDWRKFEVVL